MMNYYGPGQSPGQYQNPMQQPPMQTRPDVKTCECGTPIQTGANFCSGCGKPILKKVEKNSGYGAVDWLVFAISAWMIGWLLTAVK